jgi:hypothetical protein
MQIPVDFICKLPPIYALPSSACACWVSPLDHEVPDDSMELDNNQQQVRQDP